jgi:6-phosphofructokinase 1
MVKLKGNAVIGQSGGPTCVINRSLVAAVEELKKSSLITGIFGARHGVEGILKEEFIDLKKQSRTTLARVVETPGAALGSTRKRPREGDDDCVKIFEVFRKYDVRYFFYIGGGDSAQTANTISALARSQGYDFRTFHIPKTIDNDLIGSDHTPGYATAARFVACAFMGDDLDNRSLKGVKVNVVMGRRAGYLTAASVLGKLDEESGPHLVYFPERRFDIDRFIDDVDAVFGRLGRCVVAVSEGIATGPEDKDLIVTQAGEMLLKESVRMEMPRDAFGHPQLSGTGILADYLVYRVRRLLEPKYEALKKKFRIRGDTFGYLQRSFPGVLSEVDAREAAQVGKLAVQFALSSDIDGSVVIQRKSGPRYAVEITYAPLAEVARGEAEMPDHFINQAGNYVTQAFIDYARPLVGRLPKIGLIQKSLVPKR